MEKSVGTFQMEKSGAIPRVFIVYSSKDEEWMFKVMNYLQSLSQSGALEPWSDVCLDMGSNWKEQLKKALKSAQAALLLISPDFLKTEFIRDEEIPILLKKHEEEGIPIIPLLVEESSWELYDWLHELMSYEKKPTALSLLNNAAEVNVKLKTICNKLITQFSYAPQPFPESSELHDRLRILCVFPRPMTSSDTMVNKVLHHFDLRTEWMTLVTAVKQRKSPVALLRLRPSTRNKLIDVLREMASTDTFPHVVHFSAMQWSKGLVFQNDNGSEERVSFGELIQDLESIDTLLPLVVCRILGRLDNTDPDFESLLTPRLRSVVITHSQQRTDLDASSWADFYARLSHGADLSDVIKRAFPSTKPVMYGMEGAILSPQLAVKTPYLDEGEAVKRLPTGSPHFVGRGELLVRIASKIDNRRVTLISGLPGVGKRELAIEAAYLNFWRFTGGVVVYNGLPLKSEAESVNATSIFNNLAEQLDIDKRLGLEKNPDADRRLQLKHLLEESEFLFVLLEMDAFTECNPNAFKELICFFLDHAKKSHCIITTRENLPQNVSFQNGMINDINLTPLESEEARDLTRLIARDHPKTEYIADDKKLAWNIADLSNGYPEIITRAVGLAHSQFVEEVTKQLRDHSGPIADLIHTLVGSAVEKLDANARNVFRCLKLFPAQSISKHSWTAIQGALDMADNNEARQALITANLIRFDGKTQRFYWDKSVHDYAFQEEIEENVQHEIDRRLINIYSGDERAEDRLRTVLNQGESAVNIFAVVTRAKSGGPHGANSQMGSGTSNLVDVAYEIAKHAKQRGLEFEGRSLLRSVINICRQCAGNEVQGDRSDTAALLYDIASIEQNQGDYDSAEKHYHNSLEINEEDENQFGIARSYHGLGRLSHDKGDFESAREYYEKSLELRKKGRDQKDSRESDTGIAQLYHELGRLAHDEGNFYEADWIYKKTLNMRKSLPVDMRGIAATYYEMGRLAQNRGDWKNAESYYEDSKKYWSKGNYRIGLGIVKHAQASIKVLRGKTAKADELFDESLEIQQSAGDRRGVAATLAQRGMLAINTGNLKTATDNLMQSRDMQRSSNYQRGEIVAQIGLALIKKENKEYDGAEEDLEEVRNKCREMKDKKLLAKAELLLGWFKAEKYNKREADKEDLNVAINSLFTSLVISLKIGDRCTGAAAMMKLGNLLNSTMGIDSKLSSDAEKIIRDLYGAELDSIESACDVMAIHC
ncbi:MAG: toll/interleukin-1 receptor domain-containing protein [Pseudomonadota bacterium]